MEWYYVEAGQQAGPVTDEQLTALVETGKVRGDTLVWRQGMENWRPYGEVRAPAPVAVAPGAPAALNQLVGTGQVVCSECRLTVAQDQAIQYGTSWVCASCKPLFLQKLREGTVSYAPAVFAGFWIRFAAKFLDGIVTAICLMIPFVLLTLLFMGSSGANPNSPEFFLWFQILWNLAGMAFGIAYITFFLGRWGATPGKMVCGVKVVQADRTPITYWRAFGRAWAEYLNMFTFGIGYIIAAFDKEKRALHDHICNTRVVKSR